MNTSDKGDSKGKAGTDNRSLSLSEASARIFAEQAASMAAMTAFGISLTSRMTGIFMGAVADAIEKAPKGGGEPENPVERMARAPVQPVAAKPGKHAPEPKAATAQGDHEKAAAMTTKAAPAAEPKGKVEAVKSEKPVAKVVQLRPASKKTAFKAEATVKVETAKKAATASQPAKPAKPVLKPVAKASVAPAGKPATNATTTKKPVAAKAAAREDLKQISGIGPRLEKALHDMGIAGLSQVAALKAGDLKRIDTELGLDGRMTRDDWIGQAKALLKGGGG